MPLKILLFNNQIYGLTKGQYSPTSEEGKVTKSTPFGSQDHPFNPVSLALGAEATFVARTVDTDKEHVAETLRAAAAHQGAAFVEIYQNCNVFNDGAFDAVRAKGEKERNQIRLEHGQPIRFGAEGERGVVRGADGRLELVDVADGRRGRPGRPRRPAAPSRASPSSWPTSPTARPARRRSASSAPSSGRSTGPSCRRRWRRPARRWARPSSRSCCTPGTPGRFRRARANGSNEGAAGTANTAHARRFRRWFGFACSTRRNRAHLIPGRGAGRIHSPSGSKDGPCLRKAPVGRVVLPLRRPARRRLLRRRRRRAARRGAA